MPSAAASRVSRQHVRDILISLFRRILRRVFQAWDRSGEDLFKSIGMRFGHSLLGGFSSVRFCKAPMFVSAFSPHFGDESQAVKRVWDLRQSAFHKILVCAQQFHVCSSSGNCKKAEINGQTLLEACTLSQHERVTKEIVL
jgi:ATP-dependent RNA circularization protein (DNA/RNA ligase family)